MEAADTPVAGAPGKVARDPTRALIGRLSWGVLLLALGLLSGLGWLQWRLLRARVPRAELLRDWVTEFWPFLLAVAAALALGAQLVRLVMRRIARADAARDAALLRQRRLTAFNALRAQVNRRIATAADSGDLLQSLCAVVVEFAPLRLAFVARPDAAQRFVVLASAGRTAYLDGVLLSADPEVPEGHSTVAVCWRDQRAHYAQSAQSSERLRPWATRAAQFGLQATGSLPIRRGGRMWAVLTVCHERIGVFDDDLQALLRELAQDISRGLDRLDGEALQRALLDNAMVGIVMLRGEVIESCNQQAAKLLGSAVDAMPGQPVRRFHADEVAYARIVRASRRLDVGGVRLQSVAYRRADGERILCDVTGARLSAVDPGRTVWTLVDVTQREQQAGRLQRLARFNALLTDVQTAGSRAEDPRSVFEAVCRGAVQHLHASLAWVGRAHGDAFEILAAGGDTKTLQAVPVDPLQAEGCGAATAQAWAEQRPVFAWGTGPDPAPIGALPVRGAGGLGVVLSVHCAPGEEADEEHRKLLKELGAALERSLQDLWQRQRIAELQQLYRALMAEGDVVLQARSDASMLQRTCESLVQGTAFHASWIVRPDAQERFGLLARAGSGTEALDAYPLHVDHPQALVARVWREGRIAFNNDNDMAQADAAWAGLFLQHRWNALLAAPILRGEAVWAVLVFAAARHDAFDSGTVELCQRVAELLGHGLDELDLKQRMQSLGSEDAHRARHDPLTGLPNRFALEQHLPQALARAERNGTALALGMIDLDDFKPVNDSLGHEAGDRLLQQLALRLRDLLRASDFLVRLGGDEFVVVLEDLEVDQIAAQLGQALQRLHAAVEAPFDLGAAGSAEIGMSMGLALYPLDASDGEALMRRADAAMYRAKAGKTQRAEWWRLSGAGADNPEPEPPFDPYGEEAAALLQAAQPGLTAVADAFVAAFYGGLSTLGNAAAVLGSLAEPEMERLRGAQVGHLRALLAPRSTRESIGAAAQRLGTVHALVGIDGATLVQAYALYRELLNTHLALDRLGARTRYRLLLAADRRLQDDMQGQLRQMQSVMQQYQDLVLAAAPTGGALWADVLARELKALAALPGITACQTLRPDDGGAFVAETFAGDARAEPALTAPELRPQQDAASQGGHSLVATAWRSGEIARSAAYTREARFQPWHATMRSLGVRSGAALPVRDTSGEVVMVLAIQGAYPGQFESTWMQSFLQALQRRLDEVWARAGRGGSGAVTRREQADSYRRRLFGGGLEMVLQPIVDLRASRVLGAEALARLRVDAGTLVPPEGFLHLLGDADLGRLFRVGLDRALRIAAQWQRGGEGWSMALNLPWATLRDAACPGWVQQALRRHGLDASRLCLEVSELRGGGQALSAQSDAIARLAALGVRLAVDDLGAGDASLGRLSALPFAVIKIDQRLPRQLYTAPLDTLSLLAGLIGLGKTLGSDVVVEGLETVGMLDAAMQLGAACGQGYALARPMPAAAFEAWAQGWRMPLRPGQVGSFLGALAFDWKSASGAPDQALHPGPLEHCPLSVFLRARGAHEGEVAQWHAALHASRGRGPSPAAAQAALRRWLCARVEDEARAAGL